MVNTEKVRLSDIAEKLGISTVTVSKALSNKEGVGNDLRLRIKEMAEEMGYKSKKTVPFQSTVKITGNIGIVIPSKFFSPSSSFYWYIFNHLSIELLKHNYYTIMELISQEDENSLNLPHIIQDQKVDGVIILGQISDEYIENLKACYENFILLDFYTSDMSLDCVSNDNYYCSYMITKYVIQQGHKKLRFVGNIKATTSIRDRYMGFLKACIENNIETTTEQIISDRTTDGKAIPINFPPENDMPTAFICNCDETAATVINNLEKKGYKIPDDISITGFDNFVSKNIPSVDITTVYIRPEDTACTAVDLILKKINQQPYIKGRHLVSGSILVRKSVKTLK